jgi:hypothetical protein
LPESFTHSVAAKPPSTVGRMIQSGGWLAQPARPATIKAVADMAFIGNPRVARGANT